MTVIMNSIYESVIAILDNDKSFAINVQSYLKFLDFQHIKIFKNTAELETSDYQPTLIITEYSFKTLTGVEVIEKLKKIYKDVLIFVISNTRQISASLLSIVSGASIFLKKRDFLENKDILFENIGTWVEKQKPISLMVEETFNNIEKRVLAYERANIHV